MENPAGSDGGGNIHRVETSYNESTGQLAFSLTVDDSSDGFTLAINDGPNPKGHAGEMGLFYFDDSGPEPTVSVYSYNGQNTQTSWQDGSPEGGIQAPDQIASSLAGDNPFSEIQVSFDESGNKVMTFSVDSNVLANHTPAYPGPGGDAEWSGAQFGEDVGIWLHPVKGLETAYGEDGYLEDWSSASQGWFDTANQPTEEKTLELTRPDHYALDLAVEASFSDYQDISETHFVWVEKPNGWELTDQDLHLTTDANGTDFVRIAIDSGDLLSGEGTVTVPVGFNVPLHAGDTPQGLSVFVQSVDETHPLEPNFETHPFGAGGSLHIDIPSLLNGDTIEQVWTSAVGSNESASSDPSIGTGASASGADTGNWGGSNWSDPNFLSTDADASASAPADDSEFLDQGGNDFFVFNAFDTETFGEDGDVDKWTDVIETGLGGGSSQNVDEDGWTSDIDDGREPTARDEDTRDPDRIRSEEVVIEDENPDKLDW